MSQNKLKIFSPFALNEVGGRDNNEDSVYPAKGKAGTTDRLFMVCDGVGGANKGEIASYLLCNHLPDYFSNNPTDFVNKEYLQNALKYAEKKMTEHLDANPECKNMASTLTLLYIQNNNAFIAWAGDSRVYHIRNGKILFKTKDHSLVNLLVEQGEISEQEALTHPKKNQILRAVKGTEDPAKIDVKEISDIQKNDYFFLCTDGVLEKVDDNILCDLLKSSRNVSEIINEVHNLCFGNTKDNFSCYLVKIEEVSLALSATQSNSKIIYPNEVESPKNKSRKIIYALIFVLIIMASYFVYKTSSTKEIEKNENIDSSKVNNKVETTIVDDTKKSENLPVKSTSNENVVKNEDTVDTSSTVSTKTTVNSSSVEKVVKEKIPAKAVEIIDSSLIKIKDKIGNNIKDIKIEPKGEDSILNTNIKTDSLKDVNVQ